MATYVYVAGDGSVREVEASMHAPPRIGSRRKWDGKWYRRVPNLPRPQVSPNLHFASHALPRGRPDATGKLVSPYSKDVDQKTGKPRFNSYADVRNAEAYSKHNDHQAGFVYD